MPRCKVLSPFEASGVKHEAGEVINLEPMEIELLGYGVVEVMPEEDKVEEAGSEEVPTAHDAETVVEAETEQVTTEASVEAPVEVPAGVTQENIEPPTDSTLPINASPTEVDGTGESSTWAGGHTV